MLKDNKEQPTNVEFVGYSFSCALHSVIMKIKIQPGDIRSDVAGCIFFS